MNSILGLRRRRMAFAAVAAFAVAGGIAYAAIPDAAGVIHACYRTSTDDQQGQLRVVGDPANCRKNELAIQWNVRGAAGATGAAGPAGPQGAKGDKGDQGVPGVQGAAGADGQDGTDGQNGADGQDGADGSSPTLRALGPGNPECFGRPGVVITDAAGTTAAVCDGQRGQVGQDGTDGTPFSGTFTSPNGQYSISVTDAGVTVASPDSSIRVAGTQIKIESLGSDSIEVRSGGDLDLLSGLSLELRGGTAVTVQSNGTATLDAAGSLSIRGSFVGINGGSTCRPAARIADTIAGAVSGASVTGAISSGSSIVCIG